MIAGMHINDSKAALGSKRDRHENIGRGLIGINLFECLMNDPRLDGACSYTMPDHIMLCQRYISDSCIVSSGVYKSSYRQEVDRAGPNMQASR